MKLSSNYNPENSKFTLEVTTNLVSEYFYNLRGMLIQHNDVPKDIEVTKRGNDTALISFTMLKEEVERISTPMPKELLDKMSKMFGVPADNIKGGVIDASQTDGPLKLIDSIINQFINSAMSYKLKRTEFLPLTNYPKSDLIEDAKSALKNKRNLCIIDDFKKYKKSMNSRTYEFNQYELEYGTSEYYDVITMLCTGLYDEFKSIYSQKLVNTVWI